MATRTSLSIIFSVCKLHNFNEPIRHNSRICSRLDGSDADEELCWMEKSLEETTIEIPAKVSPAESKPAPTVEEPSELESTKVVNSAEVSRAIESTSATEELPESTQAVKHTDSLSNLLPAHTFAQISPRCYMFSGAEVTHDNMEADSDDSDEDFSDDDDDDENETASAGAAEIIVPDIENVLSNEVPVPEISPTPTTSSLSPTPSSSQLHCNDREAAEIITDIQADDAEDLEPAPIKRPRLEGNDGETVF